MSSNFLAGVLGRLQYVDESHSWLLQFGFNLGLYELNIRDPNGRDDDDINERTRSIRNELNQVIDWKYINFHIPLVTFGDITATEGAIRRTIRGVLNSRSDEDCALVLIGAAFCFLTIGTRMVRVGRRDEVRLAAKAKIEEIGRLCPDLKFQGSRFWEVLRNKARNTENGEVDALRDLFQELRKPLHILMISADPTDLDPLQLSNEEKELQKAIQGTPFKRSFTIYTKSSCTVDEINKALNQYRPSILHFSGHGSPSGLYFRNSAGSSERVHVDDLARVCRNHPGLRAVILNACYSNDHAECFRQEVGYVIAMDMRVMDKDAIRFTRHFYEALGYEGSIEGAFSQAKDAVQLQSHELQPKLIRKDDDRELSIFESSRSPIMKTTWWQRFWFWWWQRFWYWW